MKKDWNFVRNLFAFYQKFSNNSNFHRNVPGRNNHNASKLIEKYNDLAREALTNEDRVLSENYFQHADHFTRILNEQEKDRISKVSTNSPEVVTPIKVEEKTDIIEKKKSWNCKSKRTKNSYKLI